MAKRPENAPLTRHSTGPVPTPLRMAPSMSPDADEVETITGRSVWKTALMPVAMFAIRVWMAAPR